jgi:hypothetical protein
MCLERWTELPAAPGEHLQGKHYNDMIRCSTSASQSQQRMPK